MKYELAIVDTPDRDCLSYEIWSEDKLIAELFKENNEIKFVFFVKKTI